MADFRGFCLAVLSGVSHRRSAPGLESFFGGRYRLTRPADFDNSFPSPRLFGLESFFGGRYRLTSGAARRCLGTPRFFASTAPRRGGRLSSVAPSRIEALLRGFSGSAFSAYEQLGSPMPQEPRFFRSTASSWSHRLSMGLPVAWAGLSASFGVSHPSDVCGCQAGWRLVPHRTGAATTRNSSNRISVRNIRTAPHPASRRYLFRTNGTLLRGKFRQGE